MAKAKVSQFYKQLQQSEQQQAKTIEHIRGIVNEIADTAAGLSGLGKTIKDLGNAESASKGMLIIHSADAAIDLCDKVLQQLASLKGGAV